MKKIITLSLAMLVTAISYSQNDVFIESTTPRMISKIGTSHGGFYFEKAGSIKGGLIYDQNEQVIRLGHTANPHNQNGFSLLTSGANAGNFAMGMEPGQHYFSIFHNSIKVAGSVNNPNNSAHLALIEDDADDFARIWFLNSGDSNRWAIIGKSTPNDSKVGFAYNGVGKFVVDTLGRALFNNSFRLPNVDGNNGQVLTTNGAGIVSWADGGSSNGSSAEVSDTDEDTKITVEETSDSDEINMYCEDNLMISMKTDTMYIPKGVFSGYGTTEPLDPIHVVAEDDDIFAGFYAEGGAGTKHVHYILDNRTANGKRYSLVSVGDDSNIPNGSFAVRDLDNSTERILVDPDGDVGIGINTPERKLHVNGSTQIDGALAVLDSLEIGTGLGAKLYIGNDMITDGGIDILRTNANFTPSASNSYNLGGSSFMWKNVWMDGTINLGTSKLYEDGADKLKTDSHLVPESNNNRNLGEATRRWKDIFIQGRQYFGNRYLTSNAANTVILSSTNFAPTGDNVSQLGGSSNRWSEVFSANGVINTSDKRAKKDIKNLDYGLEEIMQLRPVDFNWKEKENKKKTLGLIAQELLEIIPEVVVSPTEKDALMGVKYSDLIPVLIKAIQEQQEDITKLKSELSIYAELSAEIEALKLNVANLKLTSEE